MADLGLVAWVFCRSQVCCFIHCPWNTARGGEQASSLPLWWVLHFPECVARVPVSFGGLGVRLCLRKVVSMSATVRNRPHTFATVCVTAVRLSTVASAPGVIPKACQVDSWPLQLYWCLQRRCLCE